MRASRNEPMRLCGEAARKARAFADNFVRDCRNITAQEADESEREEQMRRLGEERRVTDERFRLQSFHDAGVEPLALMPGQIGMSLPLMLSLGWSIEPDEHGVKRLVRAA